MLTIQCPHCKTGMRLKQAPPSGKVKCPKCANVVNVNPAAAKSGNASPARQAPRGQAPRGGQPLDPDDENFDFGGINFPSVGAAPAVSHFPVQGQMDVYEGPIPGDPLETAEKEKLAAQPKKEKKFDALADAAGDEQTPKKSKKSKKLDPKVLVGVFAGVAVLMIGGIVALTQFGGGGSDQPDLKVELQKTAPEGYQAYAFHGAAVLMPKGSVDDDLPTAIDSVGVLTDKSQSYFFFGAMDGGTSELTVEQMRKKTEKLLGGDFLGPVETTRNGYKGIRGTLATSLYVPERMQTEAFHHDGRFVVIGWAAGSMGASTEVQMSADRGAEAEESEVFYKSFKIGPKPSGGFF